MANTQNLINVLRKFTKDRNWGQFHQPKDLMLKLMEEVGELSEYFQWRSEDEIKLALKKKKYKSGIEDEAMDVLIVLLMIIDYIDCDIEKAFLKKVQKNALKYPVGTKKK